jgi:hypothetical protein
MKRVVLTYGLVSGALVSSFMAVSMILFYKDPSNMHGAGSMIVGFSAMLVAFSLIFVGVKKYRDNEQNGTITFGKAFGLGLLIAFIASTMYVSVWAVVYNFFIPDFMEFYSGQMVKQAQAEYSGAELQAKLAEIAQSKEWYKNPLFFTLMTYSEILPLGILVALICALILKRRNSPQPALG